MQVLAGAAVQIEEKRPNGARFTALMTHGAGKTHGLSAPIPRSASVSAPVSLINGANELDPARTPRAFLFFLSLDDSNALMI